MKLLFELRMSFGRRTKRFKAIYQASKMERRWLMKHPCGCETKKLPNGAISIKPCKLHQNYGYVWIAMQHKEETKHSEPKLIVIPLEETATEQ